VTLLERLQALVDSAREAISTETAKRRTNKGSSCGFYKFIALIIGISCGKIVVSEGNPTHEV
jgi:hypothetical protein